MTINTIVHNPDPVEKLLFAISIVQDKILARDSNLCADSIFGVNRIDRASLELAESILSGLVTEIEVLQQSASKSAAPK